MVKATVLLALGGLVLHPASANLLGGLLGGAIDWTHQQPYSAPGYGESQCNSQQSSGWNWGDLGIGSVSSYAGFNFGGGWTCQSSFNVGISLRKRGLLDGIFGVSKHVEPLG
jgi:hypothetical protein